MSVPVVTISNVETDDGAPTSAPHKVSHQSGKTGVEFDHSTAFTGTLRYHHIRIGGANRKLGKRLFPRGLICGFKQFPTAHDTRSLAITSSPYAGHANLSALDTYLTDGEGDYDVHVEARNSDGWSA